MSVAFIGTTHINLMVTIAEYIDAIEPINHALGVDFTADQWAEVLFKTNVNALVERYEDDPSDYEFKGYDTVRINIEKLSTREATKFIRCYIYQCCEMKYWNTSDACVFCSLITEIIKKFPFKGNGDGHGVWFFTNKEDVYDYSY